MLKPHRITRALRAALVVTLALAFAGCGDDASEEDANAGTSTNSGTTSTNSGTNAPNSQFFVGNPDTAALLFQDGAGLKLILPSGPERPLTDCANFADPTCDRQTVYTINDVTTLRDGGTLELDLCAEGGADNPAFTYEASFSCNAFVVTQTLRGTLRATQFDANGAVFEVTLETIESDGGNDFCDATPTPESFTITAAWCTDPAPYLP